MMRPKLISDEDLLKKVRAIFIQEGPQVSTEAIAKELGLSQAALFKRFKTKRQLMLAALAPQETPHFIPILTRGPDDRPFEDQLREVLLSIHNFFQEVVPIVSLIQYADISPQDLLSVHEVPPPVKGIRAMTDWLIRCREKGLIADIDAPTVARVLLGAMHVNMFLPLFTQDRVKLTPPKTYIPNVIRLVLNGIKKED
jgi:AcrR family transcriptional regulator